MGNHASNLWSNLSLAKRDEYKERYERLKVAHDLKINILRAGDTRLPHADSQAPYPDRRVILARGHRHRPRRAVVHQQAE